MERRGLLRTAAAGAGVFAVGSAAGTARAAEPAAAPARAVKRDASNPLRVHIVLFEGVEELDYVGPLEVFGGAAKLGKPVQTTLVTSSGPGRVKGRFGMEVVVPGAWNPAEADVLVVPGGGFGQRNSTGVWTEIDKGDLPRALAAAARPGLTFFGVCTGVILLEAAGLVGKRPSTTHHAAQDYLKGKGADVRPNRVVDDGDLVCTGGVSSGIDGALWLLEREVGADVAATMERIMEFERRGTVARTRA
ncbi:DJ-1/PfpI family protein [Streptomyces sp. LX-29]|uniref:DJ-1/PfpI family protein n=1 Tax=Streptomyces sp. LX-29 TaxID=2900152 RepID=UPI00240E187C|nr:DJ-1/PfpI family protein [Streptomyces sp. LX-29]WFB06015.1 DJ-1/PfpI family protein [Streptomyces sp. LX-29]